MSILSSLCVFPLDFCCLSFLSSALSFCLYVTPNFNPLSFYLISLSLLKELDACLSRFIAGIWNALFLSLSLSLFNAISPKFSLSHVPYTTISRTHKHTFSLFPSSKPFCLFLSVCLSSRCVFELSCSVHRSFVRVA